MRFYLAICLLSSLVFADITASYVKLKTNTLPGSNLDRVSMGVGYRGEEPVRHGELVFLDTQKKTVASYPVILQFNSFGLTLGIEIVFDPSISLYGLNGKTV